MTIEHTNLYTQLSIQLLRISCYKRLNVVPFIKKDKLNELKIC